MERNLSVNVSRGSDPHGPNGELNDDLNRVLSVGAPPQQSPQPPRDDQGPCLYLGDTGQRCGRQAVEGGFCRAHQGQRERLNHQAMVSGEAPRRFATPSRALAATIGIVGILLPYVLDLLREISRWIHSR